MLLGAVTLLWLIVINTGEFGTDDTDLRLRMAHAWWSGASEVSPNVMPPISREDTNQGVPGAHGKRYIAYDPGQALLMLPGDWLASKMDHRLEGAERKGFRTPFVNWIVFVPLNLALVLSGFALMRLFGFGEALAAVSSLAWLLGTTVLPYAQTAFQNNQVLLFVLLAHAAILAWLKKPRLLFAALSGAACGAALLMRTTSVIHLFTTGLFLLVCLFIARSGWRESSRVLGYWLLGLAPFVVFGRIFDYLRYGSLWTTGQSQWIRQIGSDPRFAGLPQLAPHFPFTNEAHVGVLGVLFSSAKSIFIYDPLLLPCLIVGFAAWRQLTPQLRCYAALAVLNLVLHIALTSRLDFWHGDWAWAARYHLTSVDLLLVALIPVTLRRALAPADLKAWLLRGAIGCAIAVQLLAVSMPTGVEMEMEVLRNPSYCARETWNYPRYFRLGERARNLYCLATHSSSPQCPAAVAARPPPGSVCVPHIEGLKEANRLAFFPFDPTLDSRSASWAGVLWGAALLLALASTGAWFYSAWRRRPLMVRRNRGGDGARRTGLAPARGQSPSTLAQRSLKQPVGRLAGHGDE